MALHVLERLAATNQDCEIWWDSSPLVYASWKAAVLSSAPEDKRVDWNAQLTRLFDPREALERGIMGFGGVTTNPPLSVQAIQTNPDFWTAEIRRIAAENLGVDVERVYWLTYLETARCAAEMSLPVYQATNGRHGHVSGEVDPRFVTDYDRRQAYDFDGMTPSEFTQFGALATTANEFAAATRKTVDFVACALEGARRLAA
jgi:transaldolase